MNESIKNNLERINIQMIEIYNKDFLHYCLKAKSYGFKKCIIIDGLHFAISKCQSVINIFNPKIDWLD